MSAHDATLSPRASERASRSPSALPAPSASVGASAGSEDRAAREHRSLALGDDLFGDVPGGADEVTLDPTDWDSLEQLSHRMLADMFEWLKGVRSRPAWQPIPDSVKATFDAAVPEDGSSADAVYDDFRRNVLPYPTGNVHPRFWGWVMGTGSATGMMAELLSGAMNGNAIGGEQSSTFLELQVLEWVKQMLAFPHEASGVLVSGGSMANLVGLTAARNVRAQLDKDGHGLVGLSAAPVLYCSTETHNSVQKAAVLLGLGQQGVRKIPVTPEYTLDIAALERAIQEDRAHGLRPFCVVGNAGTVNTGAFDDFNRIADIAAAEGLWFHVDGAFGAIAALAPEFAPLVAGMNRADSLAVDLHKWMHMPYDVGCALIRDPHAHRSSFAQSASYLDPQERGFAAGSKWFAEFGPELSRGNRALKVWMELKTNGVKRYADLVAQNVAQARYLVDCIEREPLFELSAPAPSNVVCFRLWLPNTSDDELNRLNKELLLRIQERGVALPSSTVLSGRYVLRVAITNHRTRRRDLEIFVSAAQTIAEELVSDLRTPRPA